MSEFKLASEGALMATATSPETIAAGLTEHWSPRVISELDDNYVKVAKLSGVFGWHAHEHEDEMFFVLRGRLRIEMEAGAVEIGEGEFYVVPKGVRHNPVAEQEVLVMLIERKSTLHTGKEVTERTRSIDEQLRQL
jgi:mannose-6-phosphate isomerase-like protein (cupin superfamily)